jgi:hypothetical protein
VSALVVKCWVWLVVGLALALAILLCCIVACCRRRSRKKAQRQLYEERARNRGETPMPSADEIGRGLSTLPAAAGGGAAGAARNTRPPNRHIGRYVDEEAWERDQALERQQQQQQDHGGRGRGGGRSAYDNYDDDTWRRGGQGRDPRGGAANSWDEPEDYYY